MSAYREFDPTPFLRSSGPVCAPAEPAEVAEARTRVGRGALAEPAEPADVGFTSATSATSARLPGDPFEPPPANHGPEWRRWFGLLAPHKAELGHPPAFAHRLAYGEALTAWHLQHGARPGRSYCAGCGGPVAHPVHTLPDGALVCPTDDCLIAYGLKWRTAAAAALASRGIEAPEGLGAVS
jgi:hypothetical protein